jgi:hypothetical protein
MPQNYLLSGSGLFARRESKKELLDKMCIVILGEAFHYLSCALNLEYVLPFHKVILLYYRCKLDEK